MDYSKFTEKQKNQFEISEQSIILIEKFTSNSFQQFLIFFDSTQKWKPYITENNWTECLSDKLVEYQFMAAWL